jgi:primosomal protein N' (replication factor Y)
MTTWPPAEMKALPGYNAPVTQALTGSATGVLRVVVDRPLRTSLDYLPPPGLNATDIQPGCRVRVPVGRGQAIGVVLELAPHSTLPSGRLRAAHECLDAQPLLNAELLGLLRWTADYYQHPIGEVIFAALPAALRTGAPALPLEQWLQATDAGRAAAAAGEPKRAPKQRALLSELLAAPGLSFSELTARDAEWRAVARSLRARGWVEELTTAAASSTGGDTHVPVRTPSIGENAPSPTAEQQLAIATLNEAASRFACVLLQGVTGSGKTEVYLRAAADTLARGRSVLVLVPEIGLTPQLVGRFRARFSEDIAVMHSSLTDAERLASWRSIYQRRARIVIGTRSAVFAPLADPGLIIVDEEHDSSFKQQEGGCHYSARDLAVRRAQQLQIPIVLGTATPSLETLHNAAAGRYLRLPLPRRDDQSAAPRLALIDLRAQAVHAGISTVVVQAMERHLREGGQVMVYINRRGYAPTLLCTSCGWIAPCHACDARLTVHRGAQRLRCHICGADEPLPTRCQRCGFAVKPVGQGTERIEDTLTEMFPAHRLVRLDRDTARHARDIEAVMNAVLAGEARILVGTQMITKGHHFPDVTLVAVLNADQGLFSTDFRAAERLAQTIVQVAGRAGRGARAGEVMIQTECPDHPLLQSLLAGGYEGFATAALAERQAARWPPFSRLAMLRASAPDPARPMTFLNEARASAGRDPLRNWQVRLLGPASAAMARRAGRHHAQLVIESAERGSLQRFLHTWVPQLEALPGARGVRWVLDVDPLETQ